MKLSQLRDENIDLKEVLCEYENDLQEAQNKYKNSFETVQQLQQQMLTLKTNLNEKNRKYDDLYHKYSNLISSVQQQKIKCKCGAANMIRADLLDFSCLPNRRSQEFQHIFEMLDRKDEELRTIKKYSADEKSRLLKKVSDLEGQVKQLNNQVSYLEDALKERDQELCTANHKIMEYAQSNAEESRLKDLVRQLTQDLTEAKNTRMERETGLMKDIKSWRKYADEKTKELSKANEMISTLEKQANFYKNQSDFSIKENSSLKNEIFSLKEEIASQEGIEKSLREQLKKTEEELSSTKCNVTRLSRLDEEVESFRQNCNKLKDSNYGLARKYNDLVSEYNKLEEEYRKLLEIKKHMFEELEITRNWQREQCKQDKLINDKMAKEDKHIKTLIEDRQELMSKVSQLHRDNLLLSDELEQYKQIFNDAASESIQNSTPICKSNQPENMDSLIRKIKCTAWRASQTRSMWDDKTRHFSD